MASPMTDLQTLTYIAYGPLWDKLGEAMDHLQPGKVDAVKAANLINEAKTLLPRRDV
jgi:hypothetical protein